MKVRVHGPGGRVVGYIHGVTPLKRQPCPPGYPAKILEPGAYLKCAGCGKRWVGDARRRQLDGMGELSPPEHYWRRRKWSDWTDKQAAALCLSLVLGAGLIVTVINFLVKHGS
jgi:hypothetical protein